MANHTIEAKRIHDELERKLKALNSDRRDLLNEVSRSEKELQLQIELKKKLQGKVDEMRQK